MHPTLADIVTTSADKLFDHYSLPVEITTLPREQHQLFRYAGVIGFTGEGIKGTMVVSANGPAVQATFPDMSDRDDREDWVGELCNQLLGRVANRVLVYGMSIRMSTPVALRGEKIEMNDRRAGEVAGWHLRGPGEAELFVWLAAEVEDHIDWQAPQDAEEAPEEGDLMLF